MLTRNAVLLFSLFSLLVKGDLDSNDAGIRALSTDKDSTSDEAPTESMNAISPDHPDTSSSSSEIADAANQVTASEPAANSVEEEDEDERSNSEEGRIKKLRSAKAQSPAHPPQGPAHIIINQSPTVLSQPIIPQLKALVRNQKPKRRSRTNRRQI